MYDHLSEIAARTDHANALRDARHLLGVDLPDRPPRGLRRLLALARHPMHRIGLAAKERTTDPARVTLPISVTPAHK